MVIAPTEVLAGFQLAAGLALWAAAWLGRLDRPPTPGHRRGRGSCHRDLRVLRHPRVRRLPPGVRVALRLGRAALHRRAAGPGRRTGPGLAAHREGDRPVRPASQRGPRRAGGGRRRGRRARPSRCRFRRRGHLARRRRGGSISGDRQPDGRAEEAAGRPEQRRGVPGSLQRAGVLAAHLARTRSTARSGPAAASSSGPARSSAPSRRRTRTPPPSRRRSRSRRCPPSGHRARSKPRACRRARPTCAGTPTRPR